MSRARSRGTLGAFAVAAALLAPAAAAGAAERIVAIPQSTYATSNVAIDQGEPLTFLNLDLLNHDVTARGTDAAGAPLFASELIGTGREVPVTGAEKLTPGSYAFFCTIHPNMEGTLTVGGGGSGGGGGGGGGAGPSVELDVLDSKLAAVRKSGVLRVQMTVGEPASMRLTASADDTKLGKASHDFPESGEHLMEIPVSKSAKKALRGGKAKVTVTARAEDGDGNVTKAKARTTLK